MKKNCIIIVPAHITSDIQLNALKRCVTSIQKFSSYPIFLSLSGDVKFVEEAIKVVDHHIFTSVNTILNVDAKMEVFYRTDRWKITETVPAPRKYHSIAHLQKICLGLEGAMLLGYDQFLVINYDALVMDPGFVDYMFSDENSIVFKYTDSQFTNTDVLKLNKELACKVKLLNNQETYNHIGSVIDSSMFEEIFTTFLKSSGCEVRELAAVTGTAYQLLQFKVLINSMSSGNATAAVIDNKVYLLVTSHGSPAHTLDNKLEIRYKENSIVVNVEHPVSTLLPVCDYEGEDIYMSVVTSFGEFPLVVKKETLENTRVEWF